jgi:predicted nuclease of predicted toxin-antitoxin system
MKFKIDENLPGEIVDLLVAAGHDAVSVWQQGLSGATDTQVASVCLAEGRVLVTLDVDFADPRAYPPAGLPGIVVLRLRSQSRNHVVESVRRIVTHLTREATAGRLWIVSEHQIRIRGGDESL